MPRELRYLSEKGEVLATRSITAENDTYVISQPLGLVETKKDDLEFEILTQTAIKKGPLELQTALIATTETPAAVSPKTEIEKFEGHTVRFRISKSSEALEQIRTGEVLVKLNLSTTGNKVVIGFKLLRRPRKIETFEVEQTNLSQHKNRFIDLPGLKLSLIRILEVKSSEKYPVEVQFDTRNAGTITTSIDFNKVESSPCSYSATASTTNDRFDEGLVILPADEGTTKEQLWRALSNNAFSTLVSPGSTTQIGLYATGDKARALMLNGYPKQEFQPITVPTSCRARCGEWPSSGIFVRPDNINTYKPTVIWTSRGRPGASQDCIDLANRAWHGFASPVQRWTDPQPDEQKIVRCALWELSNGSAPWDLDIRFCGSAAPGNPFGHPVREYWTLQKETTTVMGGARTSPVTVKLDTSNLRGTIKHIYPVEDKNVPVSPIAVPFASQFNLFN